MSALAFEITLISRRTGHPPRHPHDVRIRRALRRHLQTQQEDRNMNLYRTLNHIDNWLLKRWNFALNVAFFVRLGHGWRRAWNMARNTL